MQEAYDKEIARIKERLDEIKVAADEVDRIEQEMQEAFKEADPDALEKVLVRIESIDKKLGEGLRTRLTYSLYNQSEAPRIDPELLDDFAKRVEKSDKVFAARIRWEKFAPQSHKKTATFTILAIVTVTSHRCSMECCGTSLGG